MARKRRRIWLISLLNALLMLGLTFYWLSLPYTFGDEAFLIKWTSLTKKSLLGIDPKPPPESVLFVDIADSKTTLNKPNEFGEVSSFHREVITDRAHLSQFLDMVEPYKEQTRLIVIDVLFQDSSQQDSMLQASMDRLEGKLLGVSHFEEGMHLVDPVLDLPTAVATYRAAQGMFVKYPLGMTDSFSTVPTAIYEQLHQAQISSDGWFTRINRRISLPAPLVDFKVRPNDFRTGGSLQESNYAVYKMGAILESREYMLPEDIAAFFKGKLIMIGDFATDIHETPFGEMPGLLLIYNSYLTLADQDNIVSPYWVLLLLIGYWFISWRIFTERRVHAPKWLSKAFQSTIAKVILNSLDEAVLLIAITICSYFLFNIHINILVLLIYIKIVEFLWHKLPPIRFSSLVARQKAQEA